jgi:hypothetical protein
MTMNKHTILLAILTVGAAACGDNHNNTDAPVGSDAAQIPTVPALGAQIDRLGRPAINTALNHAFDANAATKNAAKDAYNAQSDPSTWASAANAGQFAANLAILDSLDTVCGNQVLYNGSPEGGGAAAANSYATLTGILLDDQLYLDSTQTACNLYLAAELNVVTGAQTFNDCGGRAPSYDVIDVTYSAVAAGLAGFAIAGQQVTPKIGDNVGPHTGANATSDTTFPFLAAPH